MEVPCLVEWQRSTLFQIVHLAVDVHDVALTEVLEERIELTGHAASDVGVEPYSERSPFCHLLNALVGGSEIEVRCQSAVLHIGTVLLRLFQSVA